MSSASTKTQSLLHGVMAALLCSSAIGVMALIELLRNRPIHLGHAADTAEAE